MVVQVTYLFVSKKSSQASFGDFNTVIHVYSSSESDMEEEDEEPEAAGPSDLGGVPWKEAVELHAKLKGDSDPGAPEDDDGLHGEMDEDEEEEEDEEDEDEEEEEEESSDGKHRVSAFGFIVLVKMIKVSLQNE